MRPRSSIARLALVLLVLVAIAPPRAICRPVPETDTEWWQELDVSGPLSEYLSYEFAAFSRFSDADPNPALTGGAAFLTWTHGALAYSMGYLHAQVRLPATGDRLNADLPIAAITASLRQGPWSLSDRLRIEDLLGVPGDPWRYRNLLSVAASPKGIAPLRALALSDEVFVDLTSGRLTRNRLLAGPIISLGARVELALDYVNERDIGGQPGRIHGVFVDMAVRL